MLAVNEVVLPTLLYPIRSDPVVDVIKSVASMNVNVDDEPIVHTIFVAADVAILVNISQHDTVRAVDCVYASVR